MIKAPDRTLAGEERFLFLKIIENGRNQQYFGDFNFLPYF